MPLVLGGTKIWYLARTLQKRGYATQVIIHRLDSPLPKLPAIADVVLGGGGGHFIALLGEQDGQVTIADPLRGKFRIPKSNLAKTFRFTGFFLAVSRK
jgi:Peptidase C39 family